MGKLPDFLSSIRPSQGLRKARDCALASVSEVVVGIGEFLCFLTAWKSYRLAVSALIFATLCPAAMMSIALPGGTTRTKPRFAIACLCWLGILCASFFFKEQYYVMLSVGIILLMSFVGFVFNRVDGWIRPRGGLDWWGSSVRW